MKTVAYWDCSSARIKKVLDELETRFDVRCVATLGELHHIVKTASPSAILIGLPAADDDRIAKIIGNFASMTILPVFLLLDKPVPPMSFSPFTTVVKCPEELPELCQKILSVSEKCEISEKEPIFIGKSEAMHRVSTLIHRYADSRHPVMILGETGTGKDLAANALHSFSSRKNNAFIALNCSAIPDSLIESELFGTEKGAFTDAVKHRGALAKASKGTLFLDEIGTMSIAAQPRLLRAVETGEYWRLGAEKPEKSDFRLLCASCKNPVDLAEKGQFRSDLLFRISDLVIVIPPLRERTEDIEELATHFCLVTGKGNCELSAAALDKLLHYPWPGNVRELKSVIARACIDVQKGTIKPKDIVFISGLRHIIRPYPDEDCGTWNGWNGDP